MKSIKPQNYFFVLLSLLLICSTTTLQAEIAPPNMASGLILQFLAFEKNLMSTDTEMKIHIIGDQDLADEMKKSIGTKIGNRNLSSITNSNSLPSDEIDVLIISNDKKIDEAIAYTRKNKIPSITNNPELVEKGISLGVGMNETGGQVILVNLSATVEENLDWKPVILKIAKTVK